jgi:hypothetical protein
MEGERQMRRTFAVAVGIGAVAAVSMALLVPTGAGAAQTPPGPVAAPTKIDALCQKLPELQAGVTDGLARDGGALTSANETLASRRTAMTFAMTELADAVVEHLGALDAGAPPGPTGAVLKTKQALYVASVVAWSRTRAQAFESEQALVFGELQQTLLDSLDQSACP